MSLTIEFEISGQKWTQVEEYSIQDSFVIDSDAWSATVYDRDPIALRRLFLPKTRVRLYVHDRLQLIGRIDATEGAGQGGTALRIAGRDYFADLVDPNIDPSVVITNRMTLESALLEGLRVFGITSIETSISEVRSKKMGTVKYSETTVEGESTGQGRGPLKKLSFPGVGTVLFERTSKTAITEPVTDAKPNDSEGALEWAQRLAARAGFIIQPGTQRNAIAVVRPDYSSPVAFKLSRPGNIQEGRARRDWSAVPTVASLRSRRVTSGLEAKGKYKLLTPMGDDSEIALYQIDECKRILDRARTISTRLAVKQAGDVNDYYCPVYFRDDDSKTEAQLDRAARRMMADRLRNTLLYTAEVKGSIDPLSQALWSTNSLCSVQDNIEDVNETLWIMDRELSYRQGEGEMTSLTLIRPASYVL